uniref:AB hydrolase-1 domain-containing protein n=1 Tax=Opuntia streptacantha TaxID=393608 RepID=A0A7C9AT74_OPUST
MALDVEELADQLGLGEKFYVVGYSMGGQIIWSCLKYIPHRLVGATLIVPVINYWWFGLPAHVSTEGTHIPWDKRALRVAHYMPWLTYWWNTQKIFPFISLILQSPGILSEQDKEILAKFPRKESMVCSAFQATFYFISLSHCVLME